MPGCLRSPTFYASIGLAILAFGAPGRAHAQAMDPATEPATTAAEPSTRRVGNLSNDCSLPYRRKIVDRWQRVRVEAAVGVRFGSFTINGDSSGTAIPFHLDLGLRRDRWLVYAGYDVFGVTARVPTPTPGDMPVPLSATGTDLGHGSGLAHRLGATARYVLGKVGESDGGFEIWAEGGLGVEHLRWDAGGTWTRPDLALGIGGTMVWLGERKHGGGTIGLRVTLAPRNDTANAPPVCGGPCDTATPPSSYDRSFLFDISVPFGT